MDGTDFLELFQRRMAQPPPTVEAQLDTLRRLGLFLTPEAEAACVSDPPFLPVLEALGRGQYDPVYGEWTPTSRQVFYMDSQAEWADEIYPIYFQGLESIAEDQVFFREIHADLRGVDRATMTGIVPISLELNRRPLCLTARFYADGPDCTILNGVNRALASQGVEKRFFFTDGGEGEVVFFCTDAWARRFEEATLCWTSDRHLTEADV